MLRNENVLPPLLFVKFTYGPHPTARFAKYSPTRFEIWQKIGTGNEEQKHDDRQENENSEVLHCRFKLHRGLRQRWEGVKKRDISLMSILFLSKSRDVVSFRSHKRNRAPKHTHTHLYIYILCTYISGCLCMYYLKQVLSF